MSPSLRYSLAAAAIILALLAINEALKIAGEAPPAAMDGGR